MSIEERMIKLENELKLLRDHRHTGIDFPRLRESDMDGYNSYARLTMGSTQNISDNTETLVNYDTEDFASPNITVNTTNKSFTVQRG